ncbi:MAG: glutamate synthase large subunit, partial [Acidimicrobiales bacterium]
MPVRQGLYDPAFEHDACGVAFVATLTGTPDHTIVEQGLSALCRMEHRGAKGAETATGDGAGILIQIPDEFFQAVVDFRLPYPGQYAMGMAFLPNNEAECEAAVTAVGEIAESEGLRVLGWRDVPFDDSMIGSMARDVMPRFRQLFIAGPHDRNLHGIDLERRAYMLRNRVRNEADVYFCSLSGRTTIYKGMLDALQVGPFFCDLSDERLKSAIALVHSRFSTNTFPAWPLAHPFRYIAHNGEFNTIRGNRNWLRAREALFASPSLPGDISRIFPINTPDVADSMSFDECLELLHLSGRSLPHSVLMMIPEAWENHETMDPARRAFYEYHSSLMEPWDGPAFVAFTDGDSIGAVLDRNGLRPGRFWVTDDGLVVMASEVGVLDLDPATIVRKGRLQPGRMFLVDTVEHRIVEDAEIKDELAGAHPYSEWLRDNQVQLSDLPARAHKIETHGSVAHSQRIFGYTTEELKILVAPMARLGAEPIGTMGTDTPLSVLSDRPKLLYDYFRQLFAQVTNPPLDAIREELVTSLVAVVGPEGNLLDPLPRACQQVVLPSPVIDQDDLQRLVRVNEDGDFPQFETHVVRGLFEVAGGGDALELGVQEACESVSRAMQRGAKFVVLSDRGSDETHAPIPSLLLTAAVHHHLIREKTRTQVGLIVETGDARAVHHMALLLSYGAAAICPYVALDSVEDLVGHNVIDEIESIAAQRNFVGALCKGVLKVMSKMGISTISSYTGAQVFEAVGISSSVIDRHFTGTTSRIQGIGMDEIAQEVALRHQREFLSNPSEVAHRELEFGGEYQWRREGEHHVFNPTSVQKLQHATRSQRYDIFKEYTQLVDEQATQLATLRGLFGFDSPRDPIDVDEVEPISEIVKRFSTGAMSYGSISAEAHETLAIAMNRIGAKSNTGEGGEDAKRFTPDSNGDLRRSAIKQVASGRFGVTAEYLSNADDIQIKMAQGAKPGEGGQLPGKKVWPWIAETRHSTTGVGLISPPPHHDIYSIEDIAQLIHDLKNANPQARVHVKLVAESGVGTVSAGVAKAHADV